MINTVILLASLAINPATIPGKLNPAVTQSNIHQTVCAKGWTRTIRPSLSYTTTLKRAQMRQYGLSGNSSNFEEDHFIALELGGHPTSTDNLRPQPWPEARKKDRIENYLHRQLCAGKISLHEAQQEIRLWPEVYQRLTGRKP